MRKSIKLITIVLFLVFIQKIGIAQTNNDQSLVLQKCIDQAELQRYYPLDATGNPDQFYMMQYVVAFPVGLNVTKSGKPVLFMSREEIIQKKIKSYFIFRSFDITASVAKASSNYFFSFYYTTNQFKMVMANIELNKINLDWSVINIKI